MESCHVPLLRSHTYPALLRLKDIDFGPVEVQVPDSIKADLHVGIGRERTQTSRICHGYGFRADEQEEFYFSTLGSDVYVYW